MFSFAFFRFYLCYLPRDGTQTAHAHTRHRCEHLLAGWIKDQDNDKTGRRGQGWTARQRRRQRPPAPHRREQLLAGWKQASRTAKTGRGRNDKREGEPRRQKKRDGDRTTPTPTTKGQTTTTTTTVTRGRPTTRRTTSMRARRSRTTSTTQHPPPLLRATACRVEGSARMETATKRRRG